MAKSKETRSGFVSGKRRLLSSQKDEGSNEEKSSCRIKALAVLTRFLFLLHTAIALWRVSISYPQEILYFLIVGVGLLIIETAYTVGVRQGREYKWFSPSVFFYLLSIVPCLWLLELNQVEQLSSLPDSKFGCNKSELTTTTENPPYTTAIYDLMPTNGSSEIRNHRSVLVTNLNLLRHKRESALFVDQNSTENSISISLVISATTSIEKDSESVFDNLASFGEKTYHDVGGFFEAIENMVDSQTWLLGLHQGLLFILVIGRWLLPKGEITRDQLSQLLLVFIGVGADILEFVTETIDHDDPSIRCNVFLHYVIYTVWSWSLIQFTLVLTASKSLKTRLGFSSDDQVELLTNKQNCCTGSIFNTADVWGILATLLLQDMPFVGFRLYMIIVHKQVNQMMVYFTGKNILVVCLQIYRLIVLKVEQKPEEDKLDQSELQPLRGTLQRLAKHSGKDNMSPDSVIKEASIKRKNDGSVTLRISLSDASKV